jgi:hypothetical protein
MPGHPHSLVRTHVFGSWKVEPDGPLPDGRDIGPQGQAGWAQNWFVLGPRGASASLDFACSTGFCSDDDETPIPSYVFAKIQDLYDQLVAEGLY